MQRPLRRKTRFRVFFWMFALCYLISFLGAHYLGIRRWEGWTRTTHYLSWKASAALAIFTALGTAIWASATWNKDWKKD
jgi:hypothetical protein